MKHWCHVDYPPKPMANEDILRLEKSLQTVFPLDYKLAIEAIGALHTSIKLLDEIVDNQFDVPDLSCLYSADEVLSETVEWREIGMPDHLIAIGSDCAGNKFCIASEDRYHETSPIYFWDHDFDDTELVAPTFNHWIAEYNKLIDLS